MKRKKLRFGTGFRMAIGNDRSQAAEVVLPPGGSEGGPDNKHVDSDQWLFVVAGAGSAIINGHRYPLTAGSLVLIERGDTHEIRSGKGDSLRTLNFYVPPAYTPDGEEL